MGFQEQEEAGMQPDPEFKAFFAGEWRELMAKVEVPGMRYASWDRKAAYLFWAGEGRADLIPSLADDTAPPQTAKPLDWAKVLHVPDAMTFPRPAVVGPEVSAASVGTDLHTKVAGYSDGAPFANDFVNPSKDAACLPSPEGIPLAFDSAKW